MIATGTVLAHYELLERLGEGAMGTVYKARDIRLRRLVALKLLLPSPLDSERRLRFLREAQAASGLEHPNLGRNGATKNEQATGGLRRCTQSLP
jgi:serine/threonine protein kinase